MLKAVVTVIFPWLEIARQRREIKRLEALIRPLDRDNDGKPGGRLRLVQPIKT